MRTLAIIFALCASAQAIPFNWRGNVWDAANAMQQPIITQVSPLGDNAFLIANGAAGLPDLVRFGNGLEYDSGTDTVRVNPTLITTATQTAINAKADSSALSSGLAGKLDVSGFTWANLGGKPTLFDGQYSSLTGTPTTFTPAAHTQAFSTITATPTTLSGYGIADGVTSSALTSGLATKEAVGEAATAQAYSIQRANHTGTQAVSTITGLATVATSGSYVDLSNKPTIPAAQVQSDWNAVSGLGAILNKPTIPTNTTQLTNGSGFITGITSGNVTTALGFTPYNATNPSAYVTQAGARSSLSLTTTGTGAASYNGTTGVLNVPTPSVMKRQETYSGTTNASGVYTVVFGTTYTVAPNIQVSLNNGTDTQTWRVTSITTTGFSVLVRNRVDVIGLLPTYANVTGSALDVLVTEK